VILSLLETSPRRISKALESRIVVLPPSSHWHHDRRGGVFFGRTSLAMTMMMAEAASPAAGGVIVSTPTTATAMHDDQRTGAAPENNAAATSMMAMMMMAGHGHGHGHGGAPSDPPQPPPPTAHHGTTASVLDRSHSYTESMVLEAFEDASSADSSCPPRHRLSATLSDVLQSLSKLSTDNGAAGWPTTTAFEDSYLDWTHSQSMPSSHHAGSRRSSADASSLPLVVPASSFRTPEIQRSVAPLQGPHLLHPPPLLHRPPTHKREHSSSSLGYGYANTTTWSCAANLPPAPPYPSYQNHPISSLHPMNSSCQSSGMVGSANKKSRTGSFLLLQSAPHLPLSPELDAAAGLSAAGDLARRGASATALGDTSANAASRGGEAGVGPWKSHVRLPPPLFSPVLPHHPPLGAAMLPDLAAGCHPGSEHPTPPGGRFLVGPANPVLAMAENMPPPLQPELPVLDEPMAAGEHPADHAAGGGDPGPVVRLQRRRGAPLPSHPLLAHVPFVAGGGVEALEPAGSGDAPLLPPPVPLISSPVPSPTIGPRRVLRMRKADAMDLALV
jgi:hypothetical protein